jgi:hypothetical protein
VDNQHIERRPIVSRHGTEFTPDNNTVLNAESYAQSLEAVSRLHYMIAFLLEKAEELRMQLLAEESEERV